MCLYPGDACERLQRLCAEPDLQQRRLIVETPLGDDGGSPTRQASFDDLSLEVDEGDVSPRRHLDVRWLVIGEGDADGWHVPA